MTEKRDMSMDKMLDRIPTHVIPYVALVWGFMCGMVAGIAVGGLN